MLEMIFWLWMKKKIIRIKRKINKLEKQLHFLNQSESEAESSLGRLFQGNFKLNLTYKFKSFYVNFR